MRQTSPTLVLRVPWSLREQLWAEATARGVDPSALIRGVLTAYLADVAGAQMGFIGPRVCIIQLVRPSMREIRIPRRQRGRPEDA